MDRKLQIRRHRRRRRLVTFQVALTALPFVLFVIIPLLFLLL